MSTQKAKAGQPKNNSGATVLYGGNVESASPVTNPVSADVAGHRSGKHGSVIKETNDASKAIAAGPIGKQRAGEYSILDYSTKVAGQNNAAISGAGAGGNRGNHFSKSGVTPELNMTGYVQTAVNYVIAEDDHVVGLAESGVVCNLPAAASVDKGHMVVVKDESGGAFNSNSRVIGDIDGTSYIDITVNYGAVHLYSNGTAWFTI